MSAPSRGRRGRALAPALLSWLLPAVLLLVGCAREAPDVRAVRKASERYLRALVRKDVEEVKRTSTNVVSMVSIVGGRVQAIGPAEPRRVATLDSLLSATTRERNLVDSLWGRARDADADSLFQQLRRLNRRYVTVRCAQRAAQASLPESALTGAMPVELRRVRVRVRFAGERVGPKPVDREMILRLARAGRGAWIVFSLYLPSDDPLPRLD
jgi:hypothetical protein